MGGVEPPGTRAIGLRLPDIYPSTFLDMFGRSSRNRVPERNVSANLSQALHMLVGSSYNEKLARDGRIEKLLAGGVSDRDVIQALYLAALARMPTPEECSELERIVRAQPSRAAALHDVLWALVTSREFAFNH